MATILLSDPEDESRIVLTALLEALGHSVVGEVGTEKIAAAVIEPASRLAMTQVRQLRARHRDLPVICVSHRRRSSTSMRLHPIAYIPKPAPVGPFVRAVSAAVRDSRQPTTAAA